MTQIWQVLNNSWEKKEKEKVEGFRCALTGVVAQVAGKRLDRSECLL